MEGRKDNLTFTAILSISLILLAGCHSHFMTVVVKNETGGQVSTVEVDYPDASFGKEKLAAGAEYDYRMKVLGDGNTKVSWMDAMHHQHSVQGPDLRQGQEGTLVITLTPATATWASHLKP